ARFGGFRKRKKLSLESGRCVLVSQESELSDLELEILAYLHLGYLRKKTIPPRVGNPTGLLTGAIKRKDDDFPVSSYLRMLRRERDFVLSSKRCCSNLVCSR